MYYQKALAQSWEKASPLYGSNPLLRFFSSKLTLVNICWLLFVLFWHGNSNQFCFRCAQMKSLGTKQHMSYGTAWLADPPHAGMGQACHWQLNHSPSHQKPILTHCQRFLSQMLYLISFFLPMMYHWSNMTIAGPVPVRGYTPLFFKLSDRVIDSKKDLVNVSQNVNL